MANCKNCLHQCYTEATEEECNFFVDTTKYVEVVRCKDCKHLTPVEGGLALCTLHYVGRAYEDYCSEGERSEGE